jgi:hypothetical protein
MPWREGGGRLAAPLRPLPSSSTGLPSPDSYRGAVPITPVDRSRCICRLLPQTVLPYPVLRPGRRPRLPFRGLLRLHTSYGPSIRSTAQGGPTGPASPARGQALSQGFDPADCSTKPPASYWANRPLPGWDSHPPGDRALRGAPEFYAEGMGAHSGRVPGGMLRAAVNCLPARSAQRVSTRCPPRVLPSSPCNES